MSEDVDRAWKKFRPRLFSYYLLSLNRREKLMGELVKASFVLFVCFE